jgi:hypothetical protein
MFTVLGIAVFMMRSLLQNASIDPERIINEKFIEKYGYLLEGLRRVGKHSLNRKMVI